MMSGLLNDFSVLIADRWAIADRPAEAGISPTETRLERFRALLRTACWEDQDLSTGTRAAKPQNFVVKEFFIAVPCDDE